jgi:hypothetical protein
MLFHAKAGFIECTMPCDDFMLNGKRYSLKKCRKLGQIDHAYSHFRLEADIYVVTLNSQGNGWHDYASLRQLPVSRTESKILTLLEDFFQGRAIA